MTRDSVSSSQADLVKASFRRVRSSIWKGLVAVFLALLIVTVVGLWIRYDDAVRDGQRNADRVLGVLAQQLAIQIDSIEQTLLELAAHSRFIGGPTASGQEWMPILNVVSAGRHGVEALMVTDARGTVTYSSIPMFMGESRSDGNSFRELSENPRNDELIADEPIRSTNDSRLVVPLGRVIRTPQAEFEGLAIANLAPEKMRDFYAAADVGENAIVWLLKPPDFVLLREPRSQTPNDEPWPAVSLTGVSGAVTGPIEDGGQSFLTTYRTDERTGLTVAISQPVSDVLTGWWNEVYVLGAITVAVGLVLLAAAASVSRATRRGEATLEEAIDAAR